MAKESLKGLAL